MTNTCECGAATFWAVTARGKSVAMDAAAVRGTYVLDAQGVIHLTTVFQAHACPLKAAGFEHLRGAVPDRTSGGSVDPAALDITPRASKADDNQPDPAA